MPVARFFCILAATAAATAAAAGSSIETGGLSVAVKSVRSASGTVRGAAVRQDGQMAGSAVAKATPGTVTLSFDALPPGDYAVRIYHDENGNGRMDRNAFGLPREGYGFSREARALLGVPSFERSRVTVLAGQVTATSARMGY